MDFSILKMEAILSSETSVQTRYTRHHIPEDGILQILVQINLLDRLHGYIPQPSKTLFSETTMRNFLSWCQLKFPHSNMNIYGVVYFSRRFFGNVGKYL
jgi:hypothetical protein